MKTRPPSDKVLILAAARLANLPLTAQRAEQLAPIMDDIFQMLDALGQLSLGEAAPACAYQAKWGD